jgi:hypothetical protein
VGPRERGGTSGPRVPRLPGGAPGLGRAARSMRGLRRDAAVGGARRGRLPSVRTRARCLGRARLVFGRLAQRKSASLTRKRSEVRALQRPRTDERPRTMDPVALLLAKPCLGGLAIPIHLSPSSATPELLLVAAQVTLSPHLRRNHPLRTSGVPPVSRPCRSTTRGQVLTPFRGVGPVTPRDIPDADRQARRHRSWTEQAIRPGAGASASRRLPP